MPTKELHGPSESQASTLGHEALTMAIGIVVERIQRLPQRDKDDLFELLKTLSSGDPEDLENFLLTMREILEQAPSRIRRMEPSADPYADAPRLAKWITYISRRIIEERTAANLTQAQLAERSGLPQSHISRLESGKHSPSRATIEKIAAALGRPVSAFDPSD